MNHGVIKSVGNGRVDVQLTGSAKVLRNIEISAQVSWNTLASGTRVLVDTVNGRPVVLHTIVDVPQFYTSEQQTYAAAGVLSLENALLADGSVPLTGNLFVTPGVKIDGYDISVLGQTIDNLQAADSIARTGWTVMTHASYLVETISDAATQVKIRHDLFADKETLAVSNTNGEVEHMKVVGPSTPTVDDYGALCYLYTVTRRTAANPVGLMTGWAAATLVNGLTLKGYINFDVHDNLLASPSMRFVLHTDIDAGTTEQIVRIGSLVNILGYTVEDYGFAVGRLSTADKYLAYSYTDNLFRIRGADISGQDESGTEVYRIWGTHDSGVYAPGDFRFGPLNGGHLDWSSANERLSFYSGANEIIYFSEDGSRFKNMVWAGGEAGPQIGIGELDGEATIIARNSLDVVQFLLRTKADDSIYIFAGNPRPQQHWIEFENGVLTVNGVINGLLSSEIEGYLPVTGALTGATEQAQRFTNGIVSSSNVSVNGVTKLGDGGVTNYAQFNSSGVLTLHGSAAIPGKMTIVFYVPNTLSVSSPAIRLHIPNTATITNVTAAVTTAPTGASLIIDVNKNGTTIFTTQVNRPTITASATEDLLSVPDVTSLALNDVLTIDIDQVGSTVAGANLVLQVRCTI